ncbi:hypothetical protein [Methylobacterium aquaticum]|uniref:hypothetical protein n=1 Tax=Methylobacterium aquaticum TaxID=270351 RepID=UPI001934ACD4|nr:hypothetical protein [Methylobacterium aquaticum]QRE76815.1 hypothetical protein F1D61_27610 [Methylobacterium aquaticum]
MTDVIKCHVLGIASQTLDSIQSDSPGGAVWSGVRVRLSDGRTRFFPNMSVDAEASLIIQSAMDCGEAVELWLSGHPKMVCVYGVKHKLDVHYTDVDYCSARKKAIKFLIGGVLMLPFFGFGVPVLILSIIYFYVASQLKPDVSRDYFLSHGDGGMLAEAA